MADYNYSYFKFVSEIIDSGCWANLSSAAKSLYPVLLKFSNESFKPVWPKTETLLKLTGFKCKKSLIQAKKELVAAGLIDYTQGSGHTSTRYYFRFDLHPEDRKSPTPEVENNTPLGWDRVTPNHINITINNQPENTEQTVLLKSIQTLLEKFDNKNLDKQDYIKNYLIQKYGDLEVGEAIKIAITKGKNGDVRYLEGILKNRSNQESKENKTIAKNKDNLLEAEIPQHLKIIYNQMNFHYKVGDTSFYKTPLNLAEETKQELIEVFAATGKKIKILKAEQPLRLAKIS